MLAEDFRIGVETLRGAAAVLHLANRLDGGERLTARERDAVEHLVASDLGDEGVRQRVDHRDADAVQAARGFVGLAVELAAGMQARHDDLEGGDARKFRMVLDRNAATIVGDGQEAVLAQMHFDAAGMAGNRLVHRVVDDFGEQVMQGVGVGAADIHAGATANRLEALEHFDVGGRVGGGMGDAGGRAGGRRFRRGGSRRALRGSILAVRAEKVFDRRHEISVRGANRAPHKL